MKKALFGLFIFTFLFYKMFTEEVMGVWFLAFAAYGLFMPSDSASSAPSPESQLEKKSGTSIK
jgi:hypothetical protein